MTIANIGDYSESGDAKEGAYCEWFDGKDKKSAIFDVRSLNKYREDSH